MAILRKHARVIAQVKKRYGTVIDLQKSPMVLIEIIEQFGRVSDDGTVSTVAVGVNAGTGTGGTGTGGTGTGGTGTGGTGTGGTSTVAVGVKAGIVRIMEEDILRAVLKLQKQVDMLGKQITGKTST